MAAHLALAPAGMKGGKAPTSVALFDQGLTQVLQASVTGLKPKQQYKLALSRQPDGSGTLENLATFTTNPAGSAIVNAVGPIRQTVQNRATSERRYLVITTAGEPMPVKLVQIQTP
jgi:hypothetical protein